MSFQDMTLLSGDEYPLALRFYETESPKAVVKFIHGMEEYQDRYQPFAEYLQAAGYTVITADLRGHGPTAPHLSHIADRDGHLRLLEDEEAILEEIHARWPGVPVILFAHSMGTIIARVLLQTHSWEFEKVVLSGYPNPNKAAGAGIKLTEMLSTVKGPTGFSRTVDSMALGTFSKAIKNAKTPVDWLSVNEANVRRYIADPLCGARFTLGSYNALFQLVRMMNNPDRYEDVKADLPILLISGENDPCTGGERGREDSEEVLLQAGFREIEVVTLEGMRHEILNETKREEVFRMILDYIGKE